MDVTDITPQLDQLEQDLSKAEKSLAPLLGDIGDISSKLPLLDKAKLYVLVSYTVEALLFCKNCSFPSCRVIDINNQFSGVAPKWGGCKEPPCIHRVDSGEAIHGKD